MYLRFLQRVREFARNHYRRRILLHKQSGTHGYRHASTVEKLSVKIAGGMDVKDLSLLRIAALLHDCIRAPGTIDHGEHAIASAEYAGRYLKSIGMGEEDVKTVETVISEHSDKSWSCELSEFLWCADKIEQISPFAPFRRAMFIGEYFRATSQRLDPQRALEILIEYYKKRLRKTVGVSERYVALTQRFQELNYTFYNELIERGFESWVWDMSWFALKMGYANREDSEAFKEYLKRIEKMRETEKHREYVSAVTNYFTLVTGL